MKSISSANSLLNTKKNNEMKRHEWQGSLQAEWSQCIDFLLKAFFTLHLFAVFSAKLILPFDAQFLPFSPMAHLLALLAADASRVPEHVWQRATSPCDALLQLLVDHAETEVRR